MDGFLLLLDVSAGTLAHAPWRSWAHTSQTMKQSAVPLTRSVAEGQTTLTWETFFLYQVDGTLEEMEKTESHEGGRLHYL